VKGTELHQTELEDPGFQGRVGRTALARALAVQVLEYRVTTACLRPGWVACWAQSGVARLEAGEHIPSLYTLSRVAQVLGIHLRIDVDPAGSVYLVGRAS
jgi:transcriptional regulator with XRE-family HTH domain